ncbi:MAG: acyltransferase [Bacteroidota bacterium]|nr:acyltransferase [Bacteroidota bacterium]
MNQRESSISYIPELDGIRALAILLVMIYHTGIPIFKGGFIAVDIFFVLSGFLISSILIKEYDTKDKINLQYFYIKRILRLAPSLLILLTTIFIISYFRLFNQTEDNYRSILLTLFYSSNWVRAFNQFYMGILSHTWSLAIEEQFYILWPVVLIPLLKIRSRKKVVILLCILALSSWLLRIFLIFRGAPVERLYNGLDTRADALLTGCILAVIQSSEILKNSINRGRICVRMIAVGALFCYFAVLFSISWRNLNNYYWLASVIQILTAFLILHSNSSESSPIKKILAFRPIVWIGSISYGLYLWHDPIYEIMRTCKFSQYSIATIGSLITFLIASLSYYLVEKPVLSLKRKLSRNTPDKELQEKILDEKEEFVKL